MFHLINVFVSQCCKASMHLYAHTLTAFSLWIIVRISLSLCLFLFSVSLSRHHNYGVLFYFRFVWSIWNCQTSCIIIFVLTHSLVCTSQAAVIFRAVMSITVAITDNGRSLSALTTRLISVYTNLQDSYINRTQEGYTA